MLAPEPPLDPSGDEGRRLLRDELLHREYHQQDLWQRLTDWLSRLIGSPTSRDQIASMCASFSPSTVTTCFASPSPVQACWRTRSSTLVSPASVTQRRHSRPIPFSRAWGMVSR